MTYQRKNRGVCSLSTTVTLSEDGTIENVEVLGGCNGNLKGICSLLKGMKAQDAIGRMRGTPAVAGPPPVRTRSLRRWKRLWPSKAEHEADAPHFLYGKCRGIFDACRWKKTPLCMPPCRSGHTCTGKGEKTLLYRFKGFDKAARRVLNEAVSTAASFGHTAAGTEHCLLAIPAAKMKVRPRHFCCPERYTASVWRGLFAKKKGRTRRVTCGPAQ